MLYLLYSFAGAEMEIAFPQKRVQLVAWFAEMKSFIMLQRNPQHVYGGDVPHMENHLYPVWPVFGDRECSQTFWKCAW
jgi:hypothetical protein